jgi:hypothetical protein
VYYEWKIAYELRENHQWSKRHSASDKDYSDEARRLFPKTIAFVDELPMVECGRVIIQGLAANDDAPVHRDELPEEKTELCHFVSISPAGNKRFFLLDEATGEKVRVLSRAYWFNDSDWHGVEPDPFFRYTIRIDGRFAPDLLRKIGVAT